MEKPPCGQVGEENSDLVPFRQKASVDDQVHMCEVECLSTWPDTNL